MNITIEMLTNLVRSNERQIAELEETIRQDKQIVLELLKQNDDMNRSINVIRNSLSQKSKTA